MDSPFVQIGFALLCLLLYFFLRRRAGGNSNPLGCLSVELGSESYREREHAIRAARELGGDEARALLLEHLSSVRAGDDEQELLTLYRALIDGWGAQTLARDWNQLPEQSRLDFLEFSRGSRKFSRAEVLVLARRGMDDLETQIASKAWRTYAYTVTSGFEHPEQGFDVPGWLRESATDSNADIQALRTRFEQRRLAEAETQGLEALVSRFRREVFKNAQPQSVDLCCSVDYVLDLEASGELQLPRGVYLGTLTGSFDNAQNAVAAGWTFSLELPDVDGEPWQLESTWDSGEFFAEILDGRNDATRLWWEDAPEEICSAFSTHPFVGPVVAYGDAWDLYQPSIDGEALMPEKKQLLKCLIAVLPAASEAGSRLAFLLYAVEDGANAGDELRPFVTSIPLERWMVGAAHEEVTEATRARSLRQ
jgi:hypothetical protein